MMAAVTTRCWYILQVHAHTMEGKEIQGIRAFFPPE